MRRNRRMKPSMTSALSAASLVAKTLPAGRRLRRSRGRGRAAGMTRVMPAAALAAAAAWFLDPQSGARRRSLVTDKAGKFLRRGARGAAGTAEHAANQASGAMARAQNPPGRQAPVDQDQTLARKVETEIFRDEDVPKGDIVVNAENGRIVLRGEAPGKMIAELEAKARAIPGVEDVENLLHPPGTQAPHSSPAGDEEVREQTATPKSRSRFSSTPASEGSAPEPLGEGQARGSD